MAWTTWHAFAACTHEAFAPCFGCCKAAQWSVDDNIFCGMHLVTAARKPRVRSMLPQVKMLHDNFDCLEPGQYVHRLQHVTSALKDSKTMNTSPGRVVKGE